MTMDAKQFAWLYLIENGHGGVTPSYYGGWDLVDKRMEKQFKRFDTNSMEKINKEYLRELKQIGVDWDKTSLPESDLKSEFNGTFADDCKYVEYLRGTLVLKNGTTQTWMAEALHVSNVFEMMAAVHDAPAKFCKIFGKTNGI